MVITNKKVDKMTNKDKISQLRSLLHTQLLPLIDNDYVLLDVPYYSNPGDTLIWEGTESLLQKCSYKCIKMTSEECFDFPKFKYDTVILLQGGGNWGDLYERHQKFRLKVIERYNKNKIIILPQSIYYKHNENWVAHQKVLKQHTNLHICVRDIPSYEQLLAAGFENVHLLPDMAFCIAQDKLHNFVVPSSGRILYVKRQDSEKPNYSNLNIQADEDSVDVTDWPTMMTYDSVQLNFYRIYNRRNLFLKKLVDWYASKILKPHIIKNAVEFISSYNYIYTTRLHVAILSVLLDKSVTLIDNSYGKNSNLYQAWLSDLDTINLVKS